MAMYSGLLAMYWKAPFGESHRDVCRLLHRSVEIFPELSRGYCSPKVCSGRCPIPSAEAISRLEERLDFANDPDAFGNLELKSSETAGYDSLFHLTLLACNRTYIKSHRTYIPNVMLLFFPLCLQEASDGRFGKILEWVNEFVTQVPVCYGYINRCVHYNMWNVASENRQALSLLDSDPCADIWDDGNEMWRFASKAKGPMWLSILSQEHRSGLIAGQLESWLGGKVQVLSNGRVVTQMHGGIGEVTVQQYRELAQVLRPITIDSYFPVCFRFPYEFRNSGADKWIQRFSSNES